MNIRPIVFGFFFGLMSWFWAFVIVGSVMYDPETQKPVVPSTKVYVIVLIINLVFTSMMLCLYLWLYQSTHPFGLGSWSRDACFLGLILMLVNFLGDVVFMGLILKKHLMVYFFHESTTGYFYPSLILQTWFFAWIVYGRNRNF